MLNQTSSHAAAGPDRDVRHRRLAQVYARDPRAEGRFWYSVVTTGVFCRPTCPSRRAQAGNIRFHDTLAEARATGFRPCLRCKPEALSQSDRHAAVVEAACRLIETGRGLSSGQLADAVGLSPSHFHRLFRRVKGSTPSAWARAAAGAVRPPEPG